MTPQELKEIALKASKKQYDEVIATLKAETEQGGFSCSVNDLTDGTIELLTKDVFFVKQKTYKGQITNSYTVSIKN